MAVGHERDMRSEVHYLCYIEKCLDCLGFCSKHILQEQNVSTALQNSNMMSWAHCSSKKSMLCLNFGN